MTLITASGESNHYPALHRHTLWETTHLLARAEDLGLVHADDPRLSGNRCDLCGAAVDKARLLRADAVLTVTVTGNGSSSLVVFDEEPPSGERDQAALYYVCARCAFWIRCDPDTLVDELT